jgi:hypothetical protein
MMGKSSTGTDPVRSVTGNRLGNWRWWALPVALLSGCGAPSAVTIAEESPLATDTNFDRLADILSGIPGAGDMFLYGGLPSEFWEPELRQTALREAETTVLHGYTVYDDARLLPVEDARLLTALLSAKESFARYRAGKSCGGFQPEFCLEWKVGEAATEALISLECGEVKLFGPKGELYCDLVPVALQKLKPLLTRHQNHSPVMDSDE